MYRDKLEKIHIQEVDEYDPQKVFEAIELVYKEVKVLGLKPREMVADITGGTKPMTAGMVLACTPADRHVEYLKPNRTFPDGRADPSGGFTPKLIDLEFFLGTRQTSDQGG